MTASDLFPACIDVTLAGFDAGIYGSNVSGIFFDVNRNHIEWTGNYLYTDIPVDIKEPILKFEAVESSIIGDK